MLPMMIWFYWAPDWSIVLAIPLPFSRVQPRPQIYCSHSHSANLHRWRARMKNLVLISVANLGSLHLFSTSSRDPDVRSHSELQVHHFLDPIVTYIDNCPRIFWHRRGRNIQKNAFSEISKNVHLQEESRGCEKLFSHMQVLVIGILSLKVRKVVCTVNYQGLRTKSTCHLARFEVFRI